jgi:hypothetical protein
MNFVRSNMVTEDQPLAVNNIGAGNVEGTGQGPNGEPGKYLKKRKLVIATIKRNYKGFKEFTNANQSIKY